MAFEFARGYMDDDTLRHALNRLTNDIYGFDFEVWYLEGGYKGAYVPFTLFEGGEAVANASANIMEFAYRGGVTRLVQIGTVMTRREYRGRGLARGLIERILRAYERECEGFYLFANDTATGFYDKLGFLCGEQYEYAPVSPPARVEGDFERVGADARDAYLRALAGACANSGFASLNTGLNMFYTRDMADAYYSRKLDAYAFASVENGVMYLDEIVCARPVSALDVIERLGLEYDNAVLRFTPLEIDARAFAPRAARAAGDHFYYMGAARALSDRLCFSPFSRA